MTLNEAVNFMGSKWGFAPAFIKSILLQESLKYAYNTKSNPFEAVSPRGATGLAQMMATPAKNLGLTDRTNPYASLDAMGKLLTQLKTQFNGNEKLMLAAYNAGPKAVNTYNGIPPYKETINYVNTIWDNYQTLLKGGKISDQHILDQYMNAAIPDTYTGAPVIPTASAQQLAGTVAPQVLTTPPAATAPAPMPPAPPQPTLGTIQPTVAQQQPAAVTVTTPSQPLASTVPVTVPAVNVANFTTQAQELMSKLQAPQTSVPQIVLPNAVQPEQLNSYINNLVGATPNGAVLQPALNAIQANTSVQANNIAALQNISSNLPQADYQLAAQSIAGALGDQQAQRDNLIAQAASEVQRNDALARGLAGSTYDAQNFNPLTAGNEWSASIADQRQVLKRMRATEKAAQEMQDANLLTNPAMFIERMLFGNTYDQGSDILTRRLENLNSSTNKIASSVNDQAKVAQAIQVPVNTLKEFLPYNLDSLALGTQAVTELANAPLKQAEYDSNLAKLRAGLIGDTANIQNNLVAQAISGGELGLKQQLQQLDAAKAPMEAAQAAMQIQLQQQQLRNTAIATQLAENNLANSGVMQQLDMIKLLSDLQGSNLNQQGAAQGLQKGAIDVQVAGATAPSQIGATNATNQGIIASTPTTTQVTIQKNQEFLATAPERQAAEKVALRIQESKDRIALGVIGVIGEPGMIAQAVQQQITSNVQAQVAKQRAEMESAMMPAQQKAQIAQYEAQAKTSAIQAEAVIGEAQDSLEARTKRIEQKTRLGATYAFLGGTGDLPPAALADEQVMNSLESVASALGITSKDAKPKGVLDAVGKNTLVAANVMNKLGLISPNNPKYPAIMNGLASAYSIAQSAIPKDTDPKVLDKTIASLEQGTISKLFGAQEQTALDVTAAMRPSSHIYGMLPSGSITAFMKDKTVAAILEQNAVTLDQDGTYVGRIEKISALLKDKPPAVVTQAIADYFAASRDANNVMRGYEPLGIPKQSGVYVHLANPIPFVANTKFDLTSPADISRLRNLNGIQRLGSDAANILSPWTDLTRIAE